MLPASVEALSAAGNALDAKGYQATSAIGGSRFVIR